MRSSFSTPWVDRESSATKGRVKAASARMGGDTQRATVSG